MRSWGCFLACALSLWVVTSQISAQEPKLPGSPDAVAPCCERHAKETAERLKSAVDRALARRVRELRSELHAVIDAALRTDDEIGLDALLREMESSVSESGAGLKGGASPDGPMSSLRVEDVARELGVELEMASEKLASAPGSVGVIKGFSTSSLVDDAGAQVGDHLLQVRALHTRGSRSGAGSPSWYRLDFWRPGFSKPDWLLLRNPRARPSAEPSLLDPDFDPKSFVDQRLGEILEQLVPPSGGILNTPPKSLDIK